MITHYIDFGIYLDVDFNISEDRAAKRDASLFGSEELAREMTRERYQAAHNIHLEKNNPKEFCDVIVKNNDPINPIIELKKAML